MALTISNLKYDNSGSQTKVTGQIAFDSSYPTGGEALTAVQLALARISNIVIEPKSGYIFDPAYSAGDVSILVYNSGGGGAIAPTVDEVVTVATNTGTLAALPAVIQNVYASTATSTGPKTILPTGTAAGAGQVAVTQTTGVLTFNAGDAVTQAKVTYIPASGASAGVPGSQVSNGTNLSTLTAVDFTAYGY